MCQVSSGERQLSIVKRRVVNGVWQMACGKRQTANGKWQTANGKRQTASVKCQVSSVKWPVASVKCQMASGIRHVSLDAISDVNVFKKKRHKAQIPLTSYLTRHSSLAIRHF